MVVVLYVLRAYQMLYMCAPLIVSLKIKINVEILLFEFRNVIICLIVSLKIKINVEILLFEFRNVIICLIVVLFYNTIFI